ncbi:DUF1128 domain-containing protein [Peribacillus alkalitolerans]|uniref:DUF1128 domain-containing protein n=1 Tax=Peribacillus alkalitolerans TaxID=1550385 RepID=UPI0013D2F1C9|nr:DUF1128 domain-containing protein [Peribacillus alkalitolerans]
MDLTKNTPENVEYMVDGIKDKLRMMNMGAVKSSHFNVEMYEDLKFLYDLVMKKNSFSPSEMEAIAEELGNLKK